MSDITPGAWAANLTPLNDDLSIDTGAYVAHIRWLLGRGCAGVAALGTTGEANSFSLDERLQVIRTLGKSGIASDRVIVGTGCCAAPDTVALTRAVLDAGFTTVLMLPPFYYKGVSDEGLFRSYAQLIETIDDPRLRIFVYDIPQQTGHKMSLDFLSRLYTAFKGTIVGVKNSSGDWPAMEAACRELPGFKVFAGTEQFLLPTLRAGGPGCISATANVTSGKLAEIVAQWQTDRADALQDAATKTRLMLQKFPAVPALKEIMAQATGRAQWRRLRPPLTNLGAADVAKLIDDARAAALLETIAAE
jgi:4-hydroxy-tetrahydrodipicolinate synthase